MMKPDMNPPDHSGAHFTWTGSHGVAEVSDFMAPSHISGRIWSDSADVGFYITSHKTGEKKLFVFREEVVRDGEVISWEFVEHPVGPVTISIFND